MPGRSPQRPRSVQRPLRAEQFFDASTTHDSLHSNRRPMSATGLHSMGNGGGTSPHSRLRTKAPGGQQAAYGSTPPASPSPWRTAQAHFATAWEAASTPASPRPPPTPTRLGSRPSSALVPSVSAGPSSPVASGTARATRAGLLKRVCRHTHAESMAHNQDIEALAQEWHRLMCQAVSWHPRRVPVPIATYAGADAFTLAYAIVLLREGIFDVDHPDIGYACCSKGKQLDQERLRFLLEPRARAPPRPATAERRVSSAERRRSPISYNDQHSYSPASYHNERKGSPTSKTIRARRPLMVQPSPCAPSLVLHRTQGSATPATRQGPDDPWASSRALGDSHWGKGHVRQQQSHPQVVPAPEYSPGGLYREDSGFSVQAVAGPGSEAAGTTQPPSWERSGPQGEDGTGQQPHHDAHGSIPSESGGQAGQGDRRQLNQGSQGDQGDQGATATGNAAHGERGGQGDGGASREIEGKQGSPGTQGSDGSGSNPSGQGQQRSQGGDASQGAHTVRTTGGGQEGMDTAVTVLNSDNAASKVQVAVTINMNMSGFGYGAPHPPPVSTASGGAKTPAANKRKVKTPVKPGVEQPLQQEAEVEGKAPVPPQAHSSAMGTQEGEAQTLAVSTAAGGTQWDDRDLLRPNPLSRFPRVSPEVVCRFALSTAAALQTLVHLAEGVQRAEEDERAQAEPLAAAAVAMPVGVSLQVPAGSEDSGRISRIPSAFDGESTGEGGGAARLVAEGAVSEPLRRPAGDAWSSEADAAYESGSYPRGFRSSSSSGSSRPHAHWARAHPDGLDDAESGHDGWGSDPSGVIPTIRQAYQEMDCHIQDGVLIDAWAPQDTVIVRGGLGAVFTDSALEAAGKAGVRVWDEPRVSPPSQATSLDSPEGTSQMVRMASDSMAGDSTAGDSLQSSRLFEGSVVGSVADAKPDVAAAIDAMDLAQLRVQSLEGGAGTKRDTLQAALLGTPLELRALEPLDSHRDPLAGSGLPSLAPLLRQLRLAVGALTCSLATALSCCLGPAQPSPDSTNPQVEKGEQKGAWESADLSAAAARLNVALADSGAAAAAVQRLLRVLADKVQLACRMLDHRPREDASPALMLARVLSDIAEAQYASFLDFASLTLQRLQAIAESWLAAGNCGVVGAAGVSGADTAVGAPTAGGAASDSGADGAAGTFGADGAAGNSGSDKIAGSPGVHTAAVGTSGADRAADTSGVGTASGTSGTDRASGASAKHTAVAGASAVMPHGGHRNLEQCSKVLTLLRQMFGHVHRFSQGLVSGLGALGDVAKVGAIPLGVQVDGSGGDWQGEGEQEDGGDTPAALAANLAALSNAVQTLYTAIWRSARKRSGKKPRKVAAGHELATGERRRATEEGEEEEEKEEESVLDGDSESHVLSPHAKRSRSGRKGRGKRLSSGLSRELKGGIAHMSSVPTWQQVQQLVKRMVKSNQRQFRWRHKAHTSLRKGRARSTASSSGSARSGGGSGGNKKLVLLVHAAAMLPAMQGCLATATGLVNCWALAFNRAWNIARAYALHEAGQSRDIAPFLDLTIPPPAEAVEELLVLPTDFSPFSDAPDAWGLGIFSFPDKAPPCQRAPEDVQRLIGVWSAFVQRVKADFDSQAGCVKESSFLQPDLSSGSIHSLEIAMRLVRASDVVTWWPQYGCALIALDKPADGEDVRVLQGHVRLLLVGLDTWEATVHGTRSGFARAGTAVTDSCAVQQCGTLPRWKLEGLIARVPSLLGEHSEAIGEKSATTKYSPAVCYEAISHAIRSMLGSAGTADKVSVPQGGFQDLGAGGSGNGNTAWPLVTQVIRALLMYAGICQSQRGHELGTMQEQLNQQQQQQHALKQDAHRLEAQLKHAEEASTMARRHYERLYHEDYYSSARLGRGSGEPVQEAWRQVLERRRRCKDLEGSLAACRSKAEHVERDSEKLRSKTHQYSHGPDAPEALFHSAVAHLELWLLGGHTYRLGSSGSETAQAVTRVFQAGRPPEPTPFFVEVNINMTILASAAIKAAELARLGADVRRFELWCLASRRALEQVVAKRMAMGDSFYSLPRHDLAQDTAQGLNPDTHKYPSCTLPERLVQGSSARDRATIDTDTSRNLRMLPIIPCGMLPGGPGASPALPSRLLDLVKLTQGVSGSEVHDLTDQLILRSIENALFGWATLEKLGQMPILPESEVASPLPSGPMSPPELKDYGSAIKNGEKSYLSPLDKVVELYRATLYRFLDRKSARACMHKEQRSRELLVVWVAYCLTEAACCKYHPLLKQYAASLRYQDLRHLLLSDKQAVMAALSVAAYLQARTPEAPTPEAAPTDQQQQGGQAGRSLWGEPVFSLRVSGRGTIDFATRLACSDPRLQYLRDIWALEHADAEARKDAHWVEVERKKGVLRELQDQLEEYEATESKADKEHGAAAKQEDETKREEKEAREDFRAVQRRLQKAAAQAEGRKFDRAEEKPLPSEEAEYWRGKLQIALSSLRQAWHTLQTARSAVERCKSEITEASKGPPFVVQPLPEHQEEALTWLFFFYMPPLLRALSRTSFLAQQLLLPLPSLPDADPLEPPCPTAADLKKAVAWPVSEEAGVSKLSPLEHYNRRQGDRTYLPALEPEAVRNALDPSGYMRLCSLTEGPKYEERYPEPLKDLKAPNVDVLYPDPLRLEELDLGWTGTRYPGSSLDAGLDAPAYVAEGVRFNPFSRAINPQDTACTFTELLDEGDRQTLQWAVRLFGDADDTQLGQGMRAESAASSPESKRGNMGIAYQDLRLNARSALPGGGSVKVLKANVRFSKPGWLDFARLRAFPLRQMEVLAAALHEGHLPLADPAVSTVVKSALYHLGQLRAESPADGSDSPPYLAWRWEWDQPDGGGAADGVLGMLHQELQGLADQLKSRRRDNVSALLLGEAASYLSCWYAPLAQTARDFAKMSSDAADSLEEQIRSNGSSLPTAAGVDDGLRRSREKVQEQMQLDQCKARMRALLCYGGRMELTKDDAAHILRLVVQIHHDAVFLEDEEERRQLRDMQVRCHNLVAGRAEELYEMAKSNASILTKALQAVLPSAPDTLTVTSYTFSKNQAQASGYSTWGSDGHCYAINILDGTVLLDGSPPSRLPSSVTSRPLYRRVFGSENFKVSRLGSGELETVQAYRGRRYSFHLEEGRLAVTERLQPPSNGRSTGVSRSKSRHQGPLTLELLDVGDKLGCGDWGKDLPVRLRELYTHWLDRERGLILLRPFKGSGEPSFLEHDIHFLLQLVPHPHAPGQAPQLHCWRVPQHLRSHTLEQLLGEDGFDAQQGSDADQITDRLLLNSLHVKGRVLAKFEDPRFIHAYVRDGSLADALAGGGSSQQPRSTGGDTGGVLVFELPRFEHEFELQGGRVGSINFTHYQLAESQQLVQQVQGTRGPSAPGGPQGDPQLVYTLPELRQYLVLEQVPSQRMELGPQAAERLVLMPVGTVKVRSAHIGGRRADAGAGGAGEEQAKGESEGGWAREGMGGSCALCDPPDPAEADGTAVAAASAYARPCARCGTLVWLDVTDKRGKSAAEDCNAKLQVHKYELHSRLGHLCASTIQARLQLAALYAATGTMLPEPRSRATGAQMALTLLRHSWVHRPLREPETAQLTSVAELGGHLVPALHVLVAEQQLSSAEVAFLHEPARPELSPPVVNQDALSSYTQQQRIAHRLHAMCGALDPSVMLDRVEEQRVLGNALPVPTQPAWMQRGRHQRLKVPPGPADAGLIKSTENILCGLLMQAPAMDGFEASEYPLGLEQGGRSMKPLEADMHGELRESWRAHVEHVRRHGSSVSVSVRQGALEVIRAEKDRAAASRSLVESFLLAQIEGVPRYLSGAPGSGPCPRRTAFRLIRCAGMASDVSLSHLMRLGVEPQLLQHLNPFLSPESQARIGDAVRLWLQLVVLEDRLGRLTALAESAETNAAVAKDVQPVLAQELEVRRTWDVSTHPEWLVFEAEGQLQIRPTQHIMAQRLIDHLERLKLHSAAPDACLSDRQGPIMQLNMGEGKTRVILPMLALYLTKDRSQLQAGRPRKKSQGAALVRLNFLSTLLDEAHDHLHQYLCASVLRRKLFRLPFNRDVRISEERVERISTFTKFCAKAGGMLLVSPEHRLSLHLKCLDTPKKPTSEPGATDTAEALAALQGVDAMPCIDLLDESDELLHHRFQLIYACGEREDLPALKQRVDAARALLTAVSHCVPKDAAGDTRKMRDADLVQQLQDNRAAEWTAPNKPGAYCGLRLLPGKETEALLPALRTAWAQALLQHPPFAMRWLQNYGNEAVQERIVNCMVDGSRSAQQLLGSALWERLTAPGEKEGPRKPTDPLQHVLAVRGLLACDILPNCLQKRHGVNYGVNRLPTARKRMAVPFRAADTPSERSEFAQPDMAIVLTLLSYANDGLTLEEVKQAAGTLLQMGDSAQEDHYREWLDQGQMELGLWRAVLEQGEWVMVDHVSKLDPTNAQQMDILHRAFSHNLATVGFFLEFCVLPVETKQYPYKLCASAWHMAHNTRNTIAGFSGTNDNHRLLPLQVRQVRADERAHTHSEQQQSQEELDLIRVERQLEGTNGKMLSVILSKARCVELPSDEAGSEDEEEGSSEEDDEDEEDEEVEEEEEEEEDVSPLPPGAQQPQAHWERLLQYIIDVNTASAGGRRQTKNSRRSPPPSRGNERFRQRRQGSSKAKAGQPSGLHALIDCGAMLKGISNREAAERLVKHLPKGLRGVLYFEKHPDERKWMVMERSGRVLPRSSSPLAERDTFAIFDEARCRGSDLKLRPDAVGLLTLSHGMTKDKFMQAAWRLRKLEHGQSLRIIGPADVMAKVRGAGGSASAAGGSDGPAPVRAADCDVRNVLTWVMANTVEATKAGLVEWARQGLAFTATMDPRRSAYVEEQHGLLETYGGASGRERISRVVKAMVKRHVQKCGLKEGAEGDAVQAAQLDMVEGIRAQATSNGKGFKVVSGRGQADEECEREMEQEQEQEQEHEMQLPRLDPMAETHWDYSTLMVADSASYVADRVPGFLPLSSLALSGLDGIAWPDNVFCTRNFVRATATLQRISHTGRVRCISLGDFMRPVDAMVAFGDSSVLLVSEREADAIVKDFRKARARTTAVVENPSPPVLMSLCYAQQAWEDKADKARLEQRARHVPLGLVLTRSRQAAGHRELPGAPPPPGAVAAIRLFDGQTGYGGEGCQVFKALERLLGSAGCVDELITVRGKSAKLSRSDLDKARKMKG